MKTLVIHRYSDPAHSWFKVSEAHLLMYAPEILPHISDYSYHRPGKAVYLEEDCDITLFIDALKAQGIVPTIRDHFTNHYSKIRGYSHYSASEVFAPSIPSS